MMLLLTGRWGLLALSGSSPRTSLPQSSLSAPNTACPCLLADCFPPESRVRAGPLALPELNADLSQTFAPPS
eukprot:CAMPEP_0173467572 /NCGR_PEP_ID=MMETSP1357-20121228/75296_1 /TAXON_ID=77926 /ORGANISM="Hemiselmis rufescens, Strain PCC563" /LENGTH=71 /DNA_ID=CAMNT_0014435719 /DNA_START=264 /DNA_END=479 /DNA_ORIENTATION=-